MFKAKFIPVAVTPLSYSNVIEAKLKTRRNNGVKLFEKDIANYLKNDSAFSFSSFMRANYAVLEALKSMDERKTILIPRYICPSFTHAILASGLSIKYCDNSPDNLSIDIKKLLLIDTEDVLALICVNMFGLSNPMKDISDFCKKNNIFLIEDLGYSFGSEYDKKKLGTFGDYSVLNFQEGKAIPIGGGMITAKSSEFSQYFSSKKREISKPNFIKMLGYSFLSKPENYNILMKYSSITNRNVRKEYSMEDTIRNTHSEFDYDFEPSSAFNSISSFQGNLGRILLQKIEYFSKIRNSNALKIEAILSRNNKITLINRDKSLTKYHYIRYPILVNKSFRNELIHLLLEKKIETSSMYAEHGLDIPKITFPGSNRILNELITLPCHPYINENKIRIMTDTIIDYLGE